MTGVVFRVSKCIKPSPTPIPFQQSIFNASRTRVSRSTLLVTAMSAAIPCWWVPGFSFLASTGWVASLQPDVMRKGKPHISRNRSRFSRNSGSMFSPPVPVWVQLNSSSLKYFTCEPRSLSFRRCVNRQAPTYPIGPASSRSGLTPGQ